MAMLLLSSCTISIKDSGSSVEAGELKKESRKLGEFRELHTSGGIDIEYIASDSAYIELEAGENILPNVKTDIYNGILKISIDNEAGSPHVSADNRTIHVRGKNCIMEGGNTMKAKLYAPSFEVYKAAGAVDFKADSIESDRFSIQLAGASDVKIKNLTCNDLNVETAGASNFELTINNAKRTKIRSAGKSDAVITFNNCDYASIDIAGASDMKLKGTLNTLDRHIAGAMDLDTDELRLKNKGNDNINNN